MSVDTVAVEADATRRTRSVQLWPGGHQLIVSGEPGHGRADPAGTLRVHDGHADRAGRPATPEEGESVWVEECVERLIDREVYCCDSPLVDSLLKAEAEGALSGTDLAGEYDWDNVSNLRPDPSDWTMRQCSEWLEDEGYSGDAPDPNPFAMSRDDLMDLIRESFPRQQSGSRLTLEMIRQGEEALRESVIEWMDDGDIDGLDAWRDAVRDNATDAEVYEWWRVSAGLAEKLDAAGYCVLDNGYGEWWGHTTTGQSMVMDGALQRVARAVFAG